MKNKKSKIVAFMLLTTMILTMNLLGTQVNAYEITSVDPNECEHVNEYIYKYTHYISINSSSHSVQEVDYYKCIKCNKKVAKIKTPTTELHSISNDFYHIGNRHYEVYSCDLCDYSKTISWECSGDPCIRPLKVNLAEY